MYGLTTKQLQNITAQNSSQQVIQKQLHDLLIKTAASGKNEAFLNLEKDFNIHDQQETALAAIRRYLTDNELEFQMNLAALKNSMPALTVYLTSISGLASKCQKY